ncbi:hypothetical protein WSM22_43600 [Cytophagales bacterium WSM2-2]|nr:hypothetical protein WSM22_43600 [Cytophagales bacterium WSM2-2]
MKPVKKHIALITMYSHIEAYPPSLNAVEHLAPLFDTVKILVRNVITSNWSYPGNVELVPQGDFINPEEVIKLPFLVKLRGYFRFGMSIRKIALEQNPKLFLFYDPITFVLFNIFVWRAVKKNNPIIWYHNHDVLFEGEVPKLSLANLFRILELRFFKRLTFFSLPNEVRLKFFPIGVLKNRPVILPNYPSKSFYGAFMTEGLQKKERLRLIFQGQISRAIRLECFVNILPTIIDDHSIELHLAGPIESSYQQELLQLAKKIGVQDKLFFYGRMAYKDLPELTSSCHVGIAIYGDHNVMVRNMSTASNKIFEYACVGLPVIINDREEVKVEFEKYSWMHCSNITEQSLLEQIFAITKSYEELSKRARRDFEQYLNFEINFLPFKEEVANHLNSLRVL